MNYKEAFAIDKNPSFNKDKKDHKYNLRNANNYEPKLIDDFYFKYFIRQLLFETPILELEHYLKHHYDYCDDPELYYSILDFKVVPKIQEIIENAQTFIGGGGYYNEVKLEYGFTESEGVIQNYNLDFPLMFHQTCLNKKQHEFAKRVEVIKEFVEDYEGKKAQGTLQWIAGLSQLAVIIRELIDKGYMRADLHRGEINNAQLSRELFKTFSINQCESPKSIEIYLSPGNKKYLKAKAVFDKRGFSIPDAKFT